MLMNMVMGFGLGIILTAVVVWHMIRTPKTKPAKVRRVIGGDLPERVAAVLGCTPEELRPR